MMPRVGEEFAGFRLLSALGRGGMSVVFHAENPRIGSSVALKVLAPELSTDDVFRARFLQESRIAASLNHPNVIPIYDMGSHEDLLYIAMRYVPGSDLKLLLRRSDRTLTPAQVLHIVDQTARALDHAHRAGLVHRDVKPANILVQRGANDDPDHVYLADFGISKHALSRTGLTPTGQFMGTIDYIAPEQITGREVDGRADIYSLGCVLYESLTGQVPFVKEADAAVIWAHVEEMPTPPSQLRPELGHAIDAVIARVLAKDPDDRYATGREFVDAARTALGTRDEQPGTALSPTVPEAVEDTPTMPAAPMPPPPEPARARSLAPTEAATVHEMLPGASSVPPSSPSGPVPEVLQSGGGSGGGDARERRRRAAWLLPALMVLLVAAAIGGIWYGVDHRSAPANAGDGESSDSAGPSTGMSEEPSGQTSGEPSTGADLTMEILTDTNSEGPAAGYIPPETCQPTTETLVVCAPEVHGADGVTFQTFDSFSDLYSAYLDGIERLTGTRPPMDQMAVDNCTSRRSSGEVTWNHMYQHPRDFTISQLEAGDLQSDVAGGRLFCTLIDGREHIIWTHNDLKLLGEVVGYGGHADTFIWWRKVHHNMGPPMSAHESPGMTMTPEESTSPEESMTPEDSMSSGM